MYLGDAAGQRLRMGELADRLLLSRSGITRLVDRLERQGLIARERCTDDGRGFFALLTGSGRAMLAAARPDHLAGVRRHFVDRLEPRRDRAARLDLAAPARPTGCARVGRSGLSPAATLRS